MNYSINRDEVKTEVQEKKIALRGLRLSVLTLSLLVGLFIMIVKCDFCGKEFNIAPCWFKRAKHHFCSRECKNKWRSENIRGKNSYNWKGGKIKRVCPICGKEFFYFVPYTKEEGDVVLLNVWVYGNPKT